MAESHGANAPSNPTGYRMIDNIEIKNYRGFQSLSIKECKRLNVIVGESGSGKTALLEALFLAMGSTTELLLRLRQQRGLEGSFQGTVPQIERALWSDFFYDLEMDRTISIVLGGITEECRSLLIGRGDSFGEMNLSPSGEETNRGSMVFTWVDAKGIRHSVTPEISTKGIKLSGTGERITDFFFFPCNLVPNSVETAGRFSELSSGGNETEFVALFKKQYPWIEDISIEALGGAPVLVARLKGKKVKLPVASLSSAINRYMSILLAIQNRKRAAVLVDEIENGVYHEDQGDLIKQMLMFARRFETQLFVSTHSKEWLRAFSKAMGNDTDDIAMWRLDRTDAGPVVHQFSGKQLRNALEIGADPRGKKVI